jgi:hypothetical protein
MNGAPPKRHWLLTQPRSASNMLTKMLNLDQQNVRPSFGGGYFFIFAHIYRRTVGQKPWKKWTAQEMKTAIQQQQESFDSLQEFLAASEAEQQTIFVKEHVMVFAEPILENTRRFPETANGDSDVDEVAPIVAISRSSPPQPRSKLNRTCLPDEFLKTWHPTFLIRHPVMLFPSMLRAMLETDEWTPETALVMGKSDLSMFFQRSLYDFYEEHFGKTSNDGREWPLVLDADDLMQHPEMIRGYAALAGLDPEKVVLEWEPATEEQLSTMRSDVKRMLSTISASSGVRKDKVAANVDLETEAKKWKVEFGDELGSVLENAVHDAIPDYEYLRSRRLRPEQVSN